MGEGNQVLDFFPRIVDVLKWHLPTLRKIEKKTSPFSWPDQTFAIENISYLLLLENLCQTLRQASSFSREDQHKKSQHKFLGLQAKFCSSPSTSISSHPQKSLLLQHSFTKSGGTIKNETTWYHPNSVWYGFYFSSNVLGMFSTNITREWKNNLNCSITKENRAELVSISIPIDANRLAAVMSILEEARNEI